MKPRYRAIYNIKLKDDRHKYISIIDFDYFDKDNDYCHDGVTKSFKLYYESLRGPLTLEKYKELFIADEHYDILKRDFKWFPVKSCTFYHLGEDEILDKDTPNEKFREITYKLFIQRMGEAFIHEALENMLLFIRKPSKPRVRLTKRSIMAYENAKKYYNLAIKLKDKYYERCSDSLLETLQKMELKLKNADEIYNKILKK